MKALNFTTITGLTTLATLFLIASCSTNESVKNTEDLPIAEKSATSTASFAVTEGNIYYLKGNNNRYVSSENGTKDMTCNKRKPGASERFYLRQGSSGFWYLNSVSNNRYVSMENSIKDLTCKRTSVTDWEKFDIEYFGTSNGNDVAAFKSRHNGTYISSESGRKDMTCNRTKPGRWEKFELIPNSVGGGGGSGGGGNTTYDAPYDIPKFKDAISKSKLQAPNSNTVATSSQLINGYTSRFFKVVNTDDIAFYQTGSSKRTELRFENNWNVNRGNRTAHANLRFISQSGKETTFMQIHDDANVGNGPNKPLLRMYRRLSDNTIRAAVKTDNGGSRTTHISCGPAPSGYFDCDVTINRGTLIIKINGATKYSRNVSYWNYPSYWKAGVYNQNSGGTTIHFNELTWN